MGCNLENSYAYDNDENRNFKRITMDDGLSQSCALKIFQDSKGYMWIGTQDGLNKYNGHQFEIYKYQEGEPNGIIGSMITSINEDVNGNIWIGTASGISKINEKTGEINNYYPEINGCNLSNYRVRDILVGSNGDILVATDDGLNKYDENNDNFIRIFYDTDEDKSLSNQAVYSLAEDNENYWVGTKEGLNKINKDTNKITKYYKNDDNENSLVSNWIYSMHIDDKGYLWIGTYYGGLNRIKISDWKIDSYKAENTKLPGGYIRDILRDSRGIVWIATDYGFVRFDEEKNDFIVYKSRSYDNKSICSDDVVDIFEDKSGSIWVGTKKGINVFNPQNLFKYYKNSLIDENTLSDNSITGIYKDNEGLLWVGTMHHGLNIIDRQSNNVTRINSKNSSMPISDNLIRDIIGIENEIWIATQNGLSMYDKDTDEVTIYKDVEGLVCNDITSLQIDSDGLLWVGTTEGISSFNRNTKSFKSYNELLEENNIDKTRIYDIYETSDNSICFAINSENSIIVFDKVQKEIKTFATALKNKNSEKVLCINEDEYGNLWIGTDYGLIKYDKEKEKYKRYTEKDGLSNNFVYGILIDEENNVWASTNYGISKLLAKDEIFTNYHSGDGLQGNEFNQYSYHKSYDGEMFFGGIDGLTSFYPREINKKNYIPKVQIEKIESDVKDLKIENNSNLSHKIDRLQFRFFMPDYNNSDKIKYAYKLSGVDKDWIVSDGQNFANYTNLYPGKYTFEVLGRNSSGTWSEVSSINFKILSPPWKTPLAYAAYVLIIICTIYLVYNRVKILDKLVKQRTSELNNKLIENEELYSTILKHEKIKNNYFSNLSHELRTPLNVMISTQKLVETLNKKKDNIAKDKIDYYMGILDRNSQRLSNLIDNIIYSSKIELGNYELNITQNDIVLLVEDIVFFMKNESEKKNINLILDTTIEEMVIECDEREIRRSILNIVSNAIEYTPNYGDVEILISEFGNYVKISVKDNGIGIDKKYHKLIFNRFEQSYKDSSEELGGKGLGLTLTRQLIELHQGHICLFSELNIGSEFVILLPIKQEETSLII